RRLAIGVLRRRIRNPVGIERRDIERSAHGGGEATHHRVARGRREGAPCDTVPVTRLAVQPAALLGRALSDSARAGRARTPDRFDAARPRRRAAGAAPRAGGLSAVGAAGTPRRQSYALGRRGA